MERGKGDKGLGRGSEGYREGVEEEAGIEARVSGRGEVKDIKSRG